MQTFLTAYHKNIGVAFAMTAKTLDWQRLGKQRVEALQILNTLEGKSSGWANHPAVRMWRGHGALLGLYHDQMIDEWIQRGYRNNMLKRYGSYKVYPAAPPWFTRELVRSHQSNLIRKNPAHYAPYWPDVQPDLPYIWPV
jgi:hypothetical protein